MRRALPLALLLLAPLACSAQSRPAAAPELAPLFERGVPFPTFLEAVESREGMWTGNYARSAVAEELLASAREIPGSWRLLAVAVDRCGDSANTVPYLARLDEALPNLEMRIVEPEDGGQAVMDAHPTPDGRAATPTFVLLDGEGNHAGCIVEQPQELQGWWLGEATEFPMRERLDRKYAWYDADAGASIQGEVVALMEAAARGTPICRLPEGEGGN